LYITYKKLKLLQVIKEVESENEFKVAPIKDIIEKLNGQRNNIARMITILHKENLVKNVLRGCWKLSEKGNEILEKIGGEEENND